MMFPKPPKKEKKKPTPMKRSPLPRGKTKIKKKSAKLAKMERERDALTNGRCWRCGCPYNLHKHEIFFGANRLTSIKWRMVVELCPTCHDVGDDSVHFNKEFDDELKDWGQRKFEELFPEEDFLKEFGKNYKREVLA